MIEQMKKAKRYLMGTRVLKLRKYLAWITLTSLLLMFSASLILVYLSPLPAGATMQATKIVDDSGESLATFQNGVNREFVKLEDISPWLIKATLAVEDRRFYRHAGMDWISLIRAVWVDLSHLARKQGASTLTQQLARNLYLTHERTWSRKLKEAWYAEKLEHIYKKDQILELYLNHIYYGHGTFGVEAAAKLYFGKPAKVLNLAESTLLAGIPKGPRYYSPHYNLASSRTRQRKVLQAMVDTNQISAQQKEKTAHEALTIYPLPVDERRTAPYFADYVKKVAIERIGIDEQLLNEGGLTIYTTLNRHMQEMAEFNIKKELHGANQDLQAALISLDPRNGYIKAMVGGRNYRLNSFNRVFSSSRQPGSSFKPIVYASALEKHAITAATRFRSEPTLFYFDNDRQIYRPSNYNNHYFQSEINLRKAIAASDNIYAVHTIMEVGPEQTIDMARRMGITSRLKAVPSLALGTFPVSPLEMAASFSTFASEGIKNEPVAITRIVDKKGKLLFAHRPKQQQIFSPALAYVTTSMLKSVFEPGGTARRVAKLIHRPVAGKTGTTNSDAWFIGYTPELSTAVWLGYDRGRSISPGEAHRAAPIFAQYTEAALFGLPPQSFSLPSGVVEVCINPDTGLLSSPLIPGKETREVFLSGTEPLRPSGPLQPSAKTKTKPQHKPWWTKIPQWWR